MANKAYGCNLWQPSLYLLHLLLIKHTDQPHTHTHTSTHTGQREDGSVSGSGEPQLVTVLRRPELQDSPRGETEGGKAGG